MTKLPKPAREILYRLPQPVRHAMVVRYRAANWRTAGILFIHIPKAAGTSINHALYGRSFGHVSAEELRLHAPALLRDLPSFAVARNPWDRLVSAYRFLKQAPGRDMAIRNRQRYSGPSFETFERFVEDWLVAQNLTNVDYVFRTQSSFVADARGHLLVDYVGHVENMREVSRFIEETLGRPIRIEHLNETRPDRDYRSEYTPRLVKLVGDLYARDVSLFGYEY